MFYSLWTGKLRVDIDGKRVSDTWHLGITKILNFTVGEKEVHELLIKSVVFLFLKLSSMSMVSLRAELEIYNQ